MNKVLGAILIVAAIVGMYRHVTGPHPDEVSRFDLSRERPKSRQPAPNLQVEREDFRCDGRVYCSEMTSCAEARYFLEHCPGVKMDGEGDGIPCEDQWCVHQ